MPNSKNLGTYYDIAAVLVAAREAGGATYELPTPAAAKRWRFRAYTYRSLLGQAEREKYSSVPGYIAQTPWDDMQLTLEGNLIHIAFGTLRGTLRAADGTVIDHHTAEPVAPPAVAEDPLLSFALELVQENKE